jgi:hypothetical protein
MSVKQQNGFWFGTRPEDVRCFLLEGLWQGQWVHLHSALAGHSGRGEWLWGPSVLTCDCGSQVFRLEMDADDRLGRCICTECGLVRRFIVDDGRFDLRGSWFAECECGNEPANIASGGLLAEGRSNPSVLLGIRCANCGFLECLAIRDVARPATGACLEGSHWAMESQ